MSNFDPKCPIELVDVKRALGIETDVADTLLQTGIDTHWINASVMHCGDWTKAHTARLGHQICAWARQHKEVTDAQWAAKQSAQVPA